jgi:hypothetical protein
MIMNLALLLPDWLLKSMLENSNLIYDPKGDAELWRKKLLGVAEDWVFSLIVGAVLVALIMVFIKWLMKKNAKGDPRKEIWTLSKTLSFIFIGLLAVIPISWIIYRNKYDFLLFIGLPGLVKGTVFVSWITYIFVIGVFHILFWRNDFYTRKI